MGRNLSRIHLVLRRHEKRRLGALVPKETRVAYIVPQTHRKPPLPTTTTVVHFNPVQSSVKVLYQPPLLRGQKACGLDRKRGRRRLWGGFGCRRDEQRRFWA